MRVVVEYPEVYVFNIKCPICGKTSRKEIFDVGEPYRLKVRCLNCEYSFMIVREREVVSGDHVTEGAGGGGEEEAV